MSQLQELESIIAKYNQINDSVLIVDLDQDDDYSCRHCIFPEKLHDIEKACIECNIEWRCNV